MAIEKTDRICVPEFGEDPSDHSKHGHVPGLTRVLIGDPHNCDNPKPVEHLELSSSIATYRCGTCGQWL